MPPADRNTVALRSRLNETTLPLGGIRVGGVLRRVSFKTLHFSNSIYKEFNVQLYVFSIIINDDLYKI